jgi:hypothetical protein
MALTDPTVALAKRKRKQAWRALHKTVKTMQTLAQGLWRDSQKILVQPSMISSAQAQTFAKKVETAESEFQLLQKELGLVVQIIASGI